jgi:hypothetical protein
MAVRAMPSGSAAIIPESLLGLFYCIAWPTAAPDLGNILSRREGARLDVAVRMRGMWG